MRLGSLDASQFLVELHGAEPSRDEHQDAKREVEDQQGRAYLSADEQYGDADNQE